MINHRSSLSTLVEPTSTNPRPVIILFLPNLAMNHDTTVNRRTPRIRIHNTNRRVRLLVNLPIWVDLPGTPPENRILQQIDVGLLASSRVPFEFVRV